jgi:molybdate transport system substrate-binding protein
MKHQKPFTFILLIVFVVPLLFTASCSNQKQAKKKELLIYCGITMIRPMSEIAEIIAEQENCEIVITKGGSGNLLKSIETNKVGDLYLPGSDSYIQTCLEKGLVTESVFVGYNKAALMVQKGNPKGITADLENLANENYYVVIGNPDSGSIGAETQKILEKKGIFDEVLNNARQLTTDSKDLVGVLVDKEADLVVNWYATSVWPENAPYMDALPIDEEYASKKKLVIGLLSTSQYPDIARKFMEYAASEEGRAIFEKYGLYE